MATMNSIVGTYYPKDHCDNCGTLMPDRSKYNDLSSPLYKGVYYMCYNCWNVFFHTQDCEMWDVCIKADNMVFADRILEWWILGAGIDRPGRRMPNRNLDTRFYLSLYKWY
jgi:hypothetical protein